MNEVMTKIIDLDTTKNKTLNVLKYPHSID